MKILLSTIYFICFFGSTQSQTIHPKSYVAYKLDEKLEIDGFLDELTWEKALWSSPFLDIRGEEFEKPQFLTQMKMLWDEHNLYIGIRMEEPHLWATYTERESVIFHENDIEIFLDPDGDTHHYYELEVNALGTVWDLLLTRPYKDGGKAINGWNINGLEYAIHTEGTVNDPTDTDVFWSIEMAIPWKALSQSGPTYRPPIDGEQWRINFSRVQWQIEAHENGYRKTINPGTGKSYPEDNWVWSPMGLINMHMPERWGYLQFSEIQVGEGLENFKVSPDERIKNELRKIYWAQKTFFKKAGHYAGNIGLLELEPSLEEISFEVSKTRFKISSPSHENDGTWYITEDSRIWKN